MVNTCHVGHITYSYIAYYIVIKPSTTSQPLEVNVPEVTIDPSPKPTKRRRTDNDINQSIFNYATKIETQLGNNMVKSFNTFSSIVNIKSATSSSVIPLITSKIGSDTLASYEGQYVKISLERGNPEQLESKCREFLSQNYVNQFLEGSHFDWLVKSQEYNEINDQCLSILNHDWTRKPHYRIACGQLLSGSILVEAKQILLINGVELYNRKCNIDPHHERFGSKFMVNSIPSLFNKYRYQLNVLSKIEQRSKKLIIGSNVFNALVISSKRLDTNSEPEVGPSTYSFTPSNNTRLYLSSEMVKRAMSTIDNHDETSQFSDFEAQLRQIRSSLTDPHTYTYSRFFSTWTDNLMHRPYTIFTIKDKSNENESKNFMVGSKVLAEIAHCMIFNKGVLEKSRLDDIDSLQSTPSPLIESIVRLYGNADKLNLIGHNDVEEVVMETAKKITDNLKQQNISIVAAIEELMKRYADLNLNDEEE
jgi:hypothetical protein